MNVPNLKDIQILPNILLKTTNVNVMVVQEENSEDHRCH